jgi:excisionase family DNA binding protein
MHSTTKAGVEPEPDRAYSLQEAAKRVPVCVNTLYAEIDAGRLTAKKVRRRTVIPATALAEWLQNLPDVGSPKAA